MLAILYANRPTTQKKLKSLLIYLILALSCGLHRSQLFIPHYMFICLKCQNFRRIKPYLKKDSLSASFISCTKLLNAPFSSRLQNNSRTHFFLFLSFFFFILNKITSCKNKISSSSESDMISKELHNPDFIFYSENLMTDVSKMIFKYLRKIIAKYRQILPCIG